MNVHAEIILRTIGVFLSVYFTVRWSRKNDLRVEYDFGILASIILAAFLAFKHPGASSIRE